MVYKKIDNKQDEPEKIVEAKETGFKDDSGYELDDSGMIPKLEELKAAGRKENEDKSTKEGKTISADPDMANNREKENLLNAMSEEDPLKEDFSRSMIIEKEKLQEEELFDYDFGESFVDESEDREKSLEDERNKCINEEIEENILDIDKEEFLNINDEEDVLDELYYPEEEGFLEKQRIFRQEDFLDSRQKNMPDIKINYFDDRRDSLSQIIEALEKIADKSQITECLEDRKVDIKRIADSMEKIADNLDKIVERMDEIKKGD